MLATECAPPAQCNDDMMSSTPLCTSDDHGSLEQEILSGFIRATVFVLCQVLFKAVLDAWEADELAPERLRDRMEYAGEVIHWGIASLVSP